VETRIQKFPTHSGTSTQTVQGTLGGLRAPSKQIAPAAFAVSKSPNTGISDSIASLLSPSGGSEMTSWEAPRLQQAHHASTMLARAEIAPHIARQLVEVMSQAAHRPTEIALSPEELGRVRMSVAAEDGKITVSILTERPETLDLMRRHIDQLGQSFRSMGYDQVSFSFGQGAQTGDQSGSNPSASSPSGPSQTDTANSGTETGANVVNLDSAPTTGIDIRL
jgi:flagellar hook-length control protein FliK